MKNGIKVTNLTKTYPNFFLDHLSFEVPTGSIVGFVGENGAGKTTTLKALLGLINSEADYLEILGISHPEKSKNIKEKIGILIDDSFYFESLQLNEINLINKQFYKNWNQEKYLDYINKFNLNPKAKFKDLSKGMKIKFKLLLALSHQPELLILDEPTSGLDPVSREEILDLFLDFIQNENHTVFLSSHITSDLDKVADYILFIHKGKIILNEQKDILLDEYGIIKCTQAEYENLPKEGLLGCRRNNMGVEVLVNNKEFHLQQNPNLIMDKANIETIMLILIKGEA